MRNSRSWNVSILKLGRFFGFFILDDSDASNMRRLTWTGKKEDVIL